MEALQILSRSEMKDILGGDPNQGCGPGGSGGLCLICHTPGGTESWCRSSSGNADSECSDIYPAYGSNVSGEYGVCATQLEPNVN